MYDSGLYGPVDEEPPKDYDDTIAEIQAKIDAVILIDSDGSWEYEDTTFPWAHDDTSNGDWYADTEYGDIYIGDPESIVDDVDSLLEALLPMRRGRFYITGYADLVYDISGVTGTSTYYGKDEDGWPIIEHEYYTDYADVEFNFRQSKITQFSIEELK